MGLVFLNGPVQNGDFTFADSPGKAVGIRIAQGLNGILGTQVTPHLWNTVTLAGDLRYRALRAAGMVQPLPPRPLFEASIIASKSGPDHEPPESLVTDADTEVGALAMDMISRGLSDGRLTIHDETVRECANCGHMTGTDGHACKVCGGTFSRARTMRHLVSNRAGQPALDFDHVYAVRCRPPLHLRNIAANVPDRLILSRTRDHGIDLGPVGLPGLVLDPRVGVHVTVLAVAVRLGADTVVMTITDNATANVAAYGRPFLDHDGLRLLYGLHGRVPYDHLSEIENAYRASGMSAQARAGFEQWFLPLLSMKERKGVQARQLPALLSYYRKALRSRVHAVAHDRRVTGLEEARHSIDDGDTDWLMRRPAAFAAALRTAWPFRAAGDIVHAEQDPRHTGPGPRANDGGQRDAISGRRR